MTQLTKVSTRNGVAWAKIRSLLSIALTRPPTDDSPASLSQRRYHKAALTSLVMMLERGVTVVLNLAIVPVTIGYLGSSEFGLWMAIANMVAFLRFADLGLGVGLQNALADCRGRDDTRSPGGYVSAAAIIASGIFLTIAAISLLGLPHLPLQDLLKAGDSAAAERILPTTQIAMIALALGLPAGILQRIYNAYQEGYIAILWLMCGRIAAFGGLLVAMHMELPLPWLVGAWMILPHLAMCLGSLQLFSRRPVLRPSLRNVDLRAAPPLLRVGLTSLVVQISQIAIVALPPLMIANQLQAAEVTPFVVALKLLGLTTMLMASILQPLWPAYSEAAARCDFDWVRRTLRRSVTTAVGITVPICLVLGLLGRPIIMAWSGTSEAVPTAWLLWGMVAWHVLLAFAYPLSMVLNGLGRFKGQAVYGSALVAIACGSGYLLLPTLGTAALAWSIALMAMGARALLMGLEFKAAVGLRRAGRTGNAALAEASGQLVGQGLSESQLQPQQAGPSGVAGTAVRTR
jgi:O-antigen/teichoic acid export membrane protein